jgi:uncharacterized protein (UPF0548 family)
MMKLLTFRKPTEEALRKFLGEQAACDFSYKAVGATANVPPDGYVVDRTRAEIGVGEAAFRSAKSALQSWEHFRLGWVEVWPERIPLLQGEVVAIMGRMLGVYSLNSCRIVYTVDESHQIVRYGYAYGTLPGHIESGEERFLIEWDTVSGKVFYDIIAFSRPNYQLAWLIYPLIRFGQRRFARDSIASMLRAVRAELASVRK